MTVAQERVEEDVIIADRAPHNSWQPASDPTALTTDQLRRETRGLRELVSTRLDAMDKAVQLLQDIVNRAPTPSVLQERTVALEQVVEEKFEAVERQLLSSKMLSDEKFEGVSKQFSERDKRTEQLSIADKTAIAAALQAQKEAAGATNESNSVALLKMEGNFTKLIDQGQVLIAAVVKNTDEKINDLKGRLDRGEGRTSVSDPAVADGLRGLKEMVASLATSRDGNVAASAAKTAQVGFIIAAVVAGVSVAGLALTLITKVSGNGALLPQTSSSVTSTRDDLSLARGLQTNYEMIQRLEQRLSTVLPPGK